METKDVWCVKTYIINDCGIITDEVRLFKAFENAEKFFNDIVEEERRIANDKEWEIEYDDNRNFEAYESGYFVHNRSCVRLFEIEIE